jgi:hypothetical protein
MLGFSLQQRTDMSVRGSIQTMPPVHELVSLHILYALKNKDSTQNAEENEPAVWVWAWNPSERGTEREELE